jgi:hypothetical protein
MSWRLTNFDEHGQCCANRVQVFAHVHHQFVYISPNRRGFEFAFMVVGNKRRVFKFTHLYMLSDRMPNTEKGFSEIADTKQHRPYLKVVFKRDDGRVNRLVRKFGKFIQAVQKYREVGREQLELLRKVFEVELIQFYPPRRAPTATFQRSAQFGEPAPRKFATAHQRLPLQAQDFSRVQVCRVLAEKEGYLGEAIAELEYGSEDGDGAPKLPGCVDAGTQLVETSTSWPCEQA